VLCLTPRSLIPIVVTIAQIPDTQLNASFQLNATHLVRGLLDIPFQKELRLWLVSKGMQYWNRSGYRAKFRLRPKIAATQHVEGGRPGFWPIGREPAQHCTYLQIRAALRASARLHRIWKQVSQVEAERLLIHFVTTGTEIRPDQVISIRTFS
jgi:hypothetical protein